MIETISIIVAGAVPLITGIFGYGKLNSKVEDMNESRKNYTERRDREISDIKTSISTIENRLENKKLDKEVFEQFATAQEKNNQVNNEQHNRIIDKLDILLQK